jgi:hypothetical protein
MARDGARTKIKSRHISLTIVIGRVAARCTRGYATVNLIYEAHIALRISSYLLVGYRRKPAHSRGQELRCPQLNFHTETSQYPAARSS